MDVSRHADRVAIVTGAASGIGAATAARLLGEGASVLFADLDEAGLGARIEALGSVPGDRVEACVADVSSESDVARMITAAVERFGKLDVLVNNAGVGRMGHVTEVEPEQWRRVMAINVDSVYLASRAALPYLVATGGSIVNTGSISGLFGDYNLATYATSKGAVVNLTRNMAIDHAGEGVRVNCVCPGPIRTEITRKMMDEPEMATAYAETIPIGRPGEPEEVAAAISFLASAEASFVTGHELVIDGGVTAATGQPNFRALVWPKVEAARRRRERGT